jgi:hypothetical protein
MPEKNLATPTFTADDRFPALFQRPIASGSGIGKIAFWLSAPIRAILGHRKAGAA